MRSDACCTCSGSMYNKHVVLPSGYQVVTKACGYQGVARVFQAIAYWPKVN